MDTFGTITGQTSGGYYAGIGYEQTESVHFEDLKAKQEIVKMKAIEVVKEFKALSKIDKETRKAKVEKRKKEAERKAAKEAQKEKDADAEAENSDDDEEDDDEDDDDLELTMRCHSYCAARQEVMDLTRSWAKEGANQIAAFPGQRAKERTKRTIDFVNLIKIKLRKTAPIGMEEESPEDAEWLDTFTTTLPAPDELAIAAGEGKSIGGRLRGAANAMFTAINSPAKAFSSIRTSTPETGKKNEGGDVTRRKTRRRDSKGRYVKDTAETRQAAPVSNLGDEIEGEIGCPIKKRDSAHDCTAEIEKEKERLEREAREEEEREKEKKEKEEREASLRERAADLVKLTGNLKLAKELKEAEDKIKATRQEAEEEARKAREEEEKAKEEAARKEEEKEKKREEEEEELRGILKQLEDIEKRESERKEMAKRKAEAIKRKREELKEEQSQRDKKRREPPKKEKGVTEESSGEEEDEEEGGKWEEVGKKKGKKSKKRRAKERALASSSEDSSSSDSESDSSEKERGKKRTMKEVKIEQLARSRMVEARPKCEDEKFGDNGLVTYQSFKNRFNAVAKVEGINPLDVLNEIGNWLTGTPKRMADAFKGADDPKQAIKDIWEQLDRYYTIKSLTAHERIQPVLKKGNIAKDDIDAHIDLVADLANIKTEAKIAKMEKQLDRVDIIRDLINGKLQYLSEEFYVEEAKEKRENPSFRYKFQDVIDVTSEKAQILKARGITSKKTKTAGVASTQARPAGQMAYNEVVENSPPKVQQPASKCECCQSQQHSIQNCNKLWNMKLEDRMVELRKYQYCFRCMLKGHIAKFCKNKPVKCGKCSLFGHPNILHGIRELRQQQQQQRLAAAAAAASDTPSSAQTNVTSTNSQQNTQSQNTSSQPSTSGSQHTSSTNTGDSTSR